MSRRLDIGVISYKSQEKLTRTLRDIQKQSLSDWRCFVVHNPSDGDKPLVEWIKEQAVADRRLVPVIMPENVGYAGGVNKLFELAETELIAYCDNDIQIGTHGWDMRFATVLDRAPKLGQVFPGYGHFPMSVDGYDECLWNAGYCWMLRRSAINATGLIDEELGHHEEVDYMIRLRLKGWRIGAVPDVQVTHDETSTRSPESEQRIHDGVVRWMNKWNRYFCGEDLTYSMTAYDPRALRYTDWPPCALYLERYFRHHLPGLNASPESRAIPNAGTMDLIRIPKPPTVYRDRVI